MDEELEHEVMVRIRNGARWLDENFPGWEARIDTDNLYLSNGSACICGQLFEEEANQRNLAEGRHGWGINGFEYATDTLFTEANSWITALVGGKKPNKGDYVRAEQVSKVLGFMSSETDDGDWIGFDDLQEGWEALLRERKGINA